MNNVIDEKNAKEVFGRNLRRLREKRGLYQKDLAELIGIKRNSISNYENGKQIPDALILKSIADFFNTTIDALLKDADAVADAAIVESKDIIIALNDEFTFEDLAEQYNVFVGGKELPLKSKKEILEKIELEYLRLKK